MKINNPLRRLTRFELALWLCSAAIIAASFLLSGGGGFLNLFASLIGVTSLIFIARGFVVGQVLMVIFSVLYGVISLIFHYYGEMVTYVFMTAPMAVVSAVEWIKHPFKDSAEVEVSHLAKKQLVIMPVLTLLVTTAFYFILGFFGTANLLFSTLSVATSFIAVYFSFLRSPYYALAYAANDVVLIILWILASLEDTSYIPMAVCFCMFLINDLYGYYSWRKMRKRQEKLR